MDSSGSIGVFQSVQFLDGFSGNCNLISASADQFMCFTGSDIRVYDTTAGSNQIVLDHVTSPNTSSLDTCSGGCYS